MNATEIVKDIQKKRDNLKALRAKHCECGDKLKSAECSHEHACGMAALDGRPAPESKEVTALSSELSSLESQLQPAEQAFSIHCRQTQNKVVDYLNDVCTKVDARINTEVEKAERKIEAALLEMAAAAGHDAVLNFLSGDERLSRMLTRITPEVVAVGRKSLFAFKIDCKGKANIIERSGPDSVDGLLDHDAPYFAMLKKDWA